MQGGEFSKDVSFPQGQSVTGRFSLSELFKENLTLDFCAEGDQSHQSDFEFECLRGETAGSAWCFLFKKFYIFFRMTA